MGAALGSGAFLGVRLEHGYVQSDDGQSRSAACSPRYRDPRRFTAEDRSIAVGLASLASLALANARLHEQTLRSLEAAEQQAGTDELDGPLQPPHHR